MYGGSYWSRREPLVSRAEMWAREEAKSVDERRQRYRCRGKFVGLEQIPAWPAYNAAAVERRREERRRELVARRAHWARQKARRDDKKRRIAEKRQRKAQREELRRVRQEEALKRREARDQARHALQLLREQEAQEAEHKDSAAQEEHQATENATPLVENLRKENAYLRKENAELKRENVSLKKQVLEYQANQVSDDEDEIPTSSEESDLSPSEEEPKEEEADVSEEVPTALFAPDEELNNLVTIWHGDITTLEIDAIVNAANKSLLGGGGIDGAIHRAAGDDLYNECRQLNGCNTGHCKISRGYALPAKYVLHTVGPIGENPIALRSCYLNCLRVAVKHGVRSVAFCGISTGIYGYPLLEASHIALRTVRRWLAEGDNRTKFDSIIFCTFLDKERDCYESLMSLYFPLPGAPYQELPLQPGEDQEVPPMIEEKDEEEDESSTESDDEREEEGEDAARSDANSATLANATEQAAVDPQTEANKLAAEVDTLSLRDEANQEASAAANKQTTTEN